MNISAISDKAQEIASRAREHMGKANPSGQDSNNQAQPTLAERGASADHEDVVSLSDSAKGLQEEQAQASQAETAQGARSAVGEEDDPGAGKNAQQLEGDVAQLASALVGKDGDPSEVQVAKGTKGADTINVSKGKDGAIKVTINGETKSYSAEEAKKLVIDAGDGNDSVVVDKNVTQGINIVGGAGDDMLVGGSGKDRIIDNAGNNAIAGRDGDDTIIANGTGAASEASTDNTPWYGKLWNKVMGKEVSATNGNRIEGGAGNDYLEGGLGNDVISGGAGNDVIYGLSGSDRITAGSGVDYVDGGRGNDTIDGDSGNDMLFGGSGNDNIKGAAGKDVIVGGQGNDNIDGGKGKDEITSTSGDAITSGKGDSISNVEVMEVPDNLHVSGTAAYQERVQSDLEALASTDVGKKMLQALKDSGQDVNFAYTAGGNSCGYYTTGIKNEDGTANVGCDSTVNYNTSRIATGGSEEWSARPPIVGMYHEMAHSYDAANGVLDGQYYNYEGDVVEAGTSGATKGAEFQAVGIDNGSVTQNPEGISENSLRAFLNLPHRDKY